jgi:Spy/CpxP family protein refolding chaperone
MKKIIALSFAFAAFTFAASAQETRKTADKKVKHERRHDGNKKEMFKDLNLSDAQKTQLKSIKEDKSLTKEQRKEKMNGVFTADQKSAMAKNRTEMQAKRKEMHEKKAKEMQEKLGLSNDQAAKLKSQREATHQQLKALKADQSLTKEQKKEKMKAIKAAAQEQRKTVLTADQLKKMDDMKKEGKGRHKKLSK